MQGYLRLQTKVPEEAVQWKPIYIRLRDFLSELRSKSRQLHGPVVPPGSGILNIIPKKEKAAPIPKRGILAFGISVLIFFTE